MPVKFYFKCDSCNATEEIQLKSYKDDDPECPHCGGSTIRCIGAPKYCGNSTGKSPALTTKGMDKPFGF